MFDFRADLFQLNVLRIASIWFDTLFTRCDTRAIFLRFLLLLKRLCLISEFMSAKYNMDVLCLMPENLPKWFLIKFFSPSFLYLCLWIISDVNQCGAFNSFKEDKRKFASINSFYIKGIGNKRNELRFVQGRNFLHYLCYSF